MRPKPTSAPDGKAAGRTRKKADSDAKPPKKARTRPVADAAPDAAPGTENEAGAEKKRSARSDLATLEIRVEYVRAKLLDGFTTTEILRIVSTKRDGFRPWNVSHRTMQNYVAEARKRIIADAKAIDRTHELGRAMARLESIYKRCTGMRDHKTALAALKEMIDLYGLRFGDELIRRLETVEKRFSNWGDGEVTEY